MRTLTGQGIPNITAASPEYPFGKYKDKTSAQVNDGTELSERTLGDCYQGMLNTITRTGATPNNQPETAFSSQFADAVELLKPVAVAVVGSDNGTTFGILAAKTWGNITLEMGSVSGTSGNIAAYLLIKRGGSLDSSHHYIVSAVPAVSSAIGNWVYTPTVYAYNAPYFSNKDYESGANPANLNFYGNTSLSASDMKKHCRAIVMVYDAGPVI